MDIVELLEVNGETHTWPVADSPGLRSAGQSAWMFASFASFDQRAASARCIAANSAGVFATGSAPSPAILSRTSASANARAISRWSRSMIGCGVPAGVTSAYQDV